MKRNTLSIILLSGLLLGSLANLFSPLLVRADSVTDQIKIHNLKSCFEDDFAGYVDGSNGVKIGEITPPVSKSVPNGGSSTDCQKLVQEFYPSFNSSGVLNHGEISAVMPKLGYKAGNNGQSQKKYCISLSYSNATSRANTNSLCYTFDANGKQVGNNPTIEGTPTAPALSIGTQYLNGCSTTLKKSEANWGAFVDCVNKRSFQDVVIDGTNYFYAHESVATGPTNTTSDSLYFTKQNFKDMSVASQYRAFTNNDILSVYKGYLNNSSLVEKRCGNDLDTSALTNAGWTGIVIPGEGKCFVRAKTNDEWNIFSGNEWKGAQGSFQDILAFFESFDMNGYCKDALRSSYQRARADLADYEERVKNGQNFTDATKSSMQQLKTTLGNLQSSDKWTEKDSSGNEVCIQIPGYEVEGLASEEKNPGSTGGGTGSSSNVTQPEDALNMDHCLAIGGAMGWILCPAIYGLKEALTNIYDQAVEPMLQVSSSLMDTSTGTYRAWGIFRNMANLVFVAVILFIIFSQVTGYGIDNYGIKKTLPKLIVTAVLVNFSFIICQLAVDISNILGAGLNSFFTNLAGSGTISFTGVSQQISGGPGFLGQAIGVFALTISAVATGALALTFFTGFGSLLLTIIVSLFGVLASVLFMFLSLGLRMAGVIILTALSPLAFVAYALPNTNGIFRKWLNAFKGLLLLYPICGLLIGGGQFASIVAFTTLPESADSNDVLAFFYVIVAILISILPFFAMPALLKKSMEATGAGAVAAFGSNLRNRINGIKGTDEFKRAKVRADHGVQSAGLKLSSRFRQSETGKKIAGSRVARGLRAAANSKAGRVVTLPFRAGSAAANRNIARTEAAYSKMESEDARAEAAVLNRTDPISYEEGIRRIDDALARGDFHAVSVNESRIAGMGRQKDLATHIASQLDSLKNVANDRAQQKRLDTLRNAFGQDSEVYKQLTTKDTAAANMLADSQYNNLSHYVKDFANGIENKDLATQGTNALHRLAPHISQSQAREVLSSSDPAIRSGMLSDSSKRQVFEAIAGGANNGAGPTIFGDRQLVADAANSFNAQQQAANQAAAAQMIDIQRMRRDEEDSHNRGKVDFEIRNMAGITETVNGYMPQGFNARNATIVRQDINTQDIIIRDNATGQEWNINTGRYVGNSSGPIHNPQPGGNPPSNNS